MSLKVHCLKLFLLYIIQIVVDTVGSKSYVRFTEMHLSCAFFLLESLFFFRFQPTPICSIRPQRQMYTLDHDRY